MDIVRCIADFNKGRDPQRLAMKYAKMRSGPFVFLRGTCHLFYRRLPNERVFAKAPLTWLCGDLHLENFGSYKGDNRLTYFDINDFDEAALGPCTWDLVRFLVSVLLGTCGLQIKHSDAKMLCRAFLDSYGVTLAQGKARWVERETSQGLVHDLLSSLARRHRPAFLDRRTVVKGKKRKLRIDGRKALPVSEGQREKVTAFLAAFAKKQPNPDFFRVIDVGRRIAGTGSLGLDRFVILAKGKGSPGANYLLDLKEALPSSLAPRLKNPQPHWTSEAHRVVTIQQRMQAISMAFLQPVRIGKKSYVLRELMPSEDRVALERSREKLSKLETVIRSMGQIVAWDHLRSSGRRGAAMADELVDFGPKENGRKTLLDAAFACCEQAESDWRKFSVAFDDGFFQ